MRFVYVLEDDLRFQKQIVDAIQEIDPKIQVRLFSQLEDFSNWLRDMMQKGPTAIVTGGRVPDGVVVPPIDASEANQLVCIISKIEYLGKKQIPLLRKTRDFLIKRGICTAEDPTAFVLTAFDNPEFKVKELEDGILNNVICKPFDKLMLSQHLTFAIDGRHRPSKYTIQNQKTSTQIEMLKEVKMESLSEVGFITRSDQEFTPGAFSKYYGNAFISERLRSVHAILTSCKKHPESENEFQLSFTFYGIDPSQSNAIRRKLKEVKDKKEEKEKFVDFDWLKINEGRRPASPDISVVVIDDTSLFAKGVSDALKRRFKNVNVVQYENYPDFLLDFDPKAAEQEGKKYPKAFSSGPEIEIQLDGTGKVITSIVGQIPPTTMCLGQKVSDIPAKTKFWADLLGPQMTKWQDWLKNSFSTVPFMVGTGDNTFFFRPAGFRSEKGFIYAKLTELTPDERIEYLKKNSRIPQRTDLIIAGYRHFQNKPEERWPVIREELKKRANEKTFPYVAVVAARDFSDAEKREFSAFSEEIFYLPVDRASLLIKMKVWFPDLRWEGDDVPIQTMKQPEMIRAAGPVKVSEISEAGLVLSYHRSLDISTFREFILWQPFEVGAPAPVATCNFVEEVGKGEFSIHFVFFGVTDHFLKAVRIWIRENYVLSKDKGGS